MNPEKQKNIEKQHNDSHLWKQLLTTKRVFDSKSMHFPQVKACRLRIAYSKLQSPRHITLTPRLSQAQKSSYLFEKNNTFQIAKRNNNETKDNNSNNLKLGVIIQNKSRYSSFDKSKYIAFDSSQEQPQLIRTIDVSQIKKLKQNKNKKIIQQPNNKSNPFKKSQQFTQYFKKIIMNHKANYDPSKFMSEGKGLSISDRSHFQKYERIKLTMLNRKIQQKQTDLFCMSSKVNHKYPYRIYPQLEAKSLKRLEKDKKQPVRPFKKQNNKGHEKFTINKQENNNQFEFEPWQSNSIYDMQTQ